MVTFVEQNFIKYVVIFHIPIVPRAKLRLQVLFKRFHPRINLTTLFLTKTYLLNTIKPFSDHEYRFLGPKQQKVATLRNLKFKILSLQDTKLGQMRPGAKISAL
jgi:hypothetical protein